MSLTTMRFDNARLALLPDSHLAFRTVGTDSGHALRCLFEGKNGRCRYSQGLKRCPEP